MNRLRTVALVALLALSLATPSAQVTPVSAVLTSSTCTTAAQFQSGCVWIQMGQNGGLAVQITGTFSGTLTFEATVNGDTYQALTLYPTNSTTGATTASATGEWVGAAGALTFVRVRFSSYTSGSATVMLQTAPISAAGGSGGGGGGGGGAVTIADGADVAEGLTTDAAVTGNSAGTVSAKLRGINTTLSSGVTVSQATASSLNATVVQGTAASLNATVVQGTATSLKTQAENYQGGVAVSAAAPLQVTLANTGANATAVKVDGSAVTQPVSGTVAVSSITTSVTPGTGLANLGKAEDLASANGDVGVVALSMRVDSLTGSTTNDGDYQPVKSDPAGGTYVTIANGSGTDANNYALAAGAATATLGAGSNTCYITTTLSTNGTICKQAGGLLWGIRAVNTTSTNYYLKLYNLATAPTCSSATGYVETVPILATGGIAYPASVGQTFSTGIAFCVVGGISSTDSSNAATGVTISLQWK